MLSFLNNTYRFRIFFLGLSLLVCPEATIAQQSITVTGVVLDGVTDSPIVGASVSNGQHAVTTGRDGRFLIEVYTGASELRFEAEGYLETVSPLFGVDIEVRLFPRGFKETVEVVSRISESEGLSSTPVTPDVVFRAPGSIDNVFRTLDTLAGVVSTDDFGSRLAVRGGTPDQNLTIMDGIEVHNPYRLFGIASAFNPETVETFQLTAGGFGAAYGDRLSSLLIVDNRSGSSEFQGSTAVSVTDANVVLEGKVPLGDGGSWLLSARRTYYDLVIGRFLKKQNFPSFADLQLQVGWRLGPGHRFTLIGIQSVENADLDIDTDRPDERVALGSDVSNGLVSARFNAVFGSSATATTTVSWYRNRETVDFDGLIRAEARRSNAVDDDIAFGRAEITFDRSINVRDISLRQEASFEISPRHFLRTGFELHRLATSVGLSITGDRNEQQPNGSSVQGGAGLPDKLDSRLMGTRGGLWLQDTFKPLPGVSFEPGLRLDWSTVNGGVTISPRFSAGYALSDRVRLRAAMGLYTQSPGYEKLTQSDYFIDLSDTRKLGLLHEKATHVVIGVEREFGDDLTARVEGYYKRFSDLIIGRLETELERHLRVAQYDFSTELQDSVPAMPIIVSNPINDASGDAYGLDVFVTHTNSAAPLTGWISYAWGRATRESYGHRYAFEYDRRHAFNVVGRYRFTSRWDLAATTRLASGFPHTAPVGLRVLAVKDDRDRLVPATDPAGNLIYGVDYGGVENLNKARLPHYARVDLRVTYQRSSAPWPWSFYVEVINLLARDNAVVLEPRLDHDPGAGRPRLSEVPAQGFPLIPTFGVRVRF